MTAHHLIIEAGPGTVRRLCCGTGESASAAVPALDGMDDPVTLIDGQPASVAELWAGVLRSLACPGRSAESVLVVHPSWWSASRVELVVCAARALGGDAVTRTRAQLFADGQVVVEIAAQLVAISGAGTVAQPRTGSPDGVVEAVVQRVVAMSRGSTTVLIDAPSGVGGATALAEMIAVRLRAVRHEVAVELVDDSRLAALAATALPGPTRPSPPNPASGRGRAARRTPALLAAGVVLSAAALGAGSWNRRPAPSVPGVPTTVLVEGRVAVQVPAQWPVQRVTDGPGSARVEVVSPSDPKLALHITQSPAAGGTPAAAAESLDRALAQANAAESANVFVDFNPSAISAGRPAVSYRELRPGRHIDWTVLVDGVLLIGIGCQSAPGGADAVHAVCDQAVRSARALR